MKNVWTDNVGSRLKEVMLHEFQVYKACDLEIFCISPFSDCVWTDNVGSRLKEACLHGLSFQECSSMCGLVIFRSFLLFVF